jgi:anhydro-N-acetylmuramic acid kinase
VRAVGLMSGTSLDGIDAAYLELVPRGIGYRVELLRFACAPFEAPLRARLEAALPPSRASAEEVAVIDSELGIALGRAGADVAAGEPLDFVASHGLTLFHDGAAHRTLQAGDPYAIRAAVGATVAFDFRRADCAFGGQGAPLVPYVDALLFAEPERAAIALNLGGIANLTLVPPGAAPADVRAWDVGPANMLLDAFVRERTAGRESFDVGGAYAARGRVDEPLLAHMLDEPYFAAAPPKSTGRERFGAQFLLPHATALAVLGTEDGCATLAALTVEAIARDVARFGPPAARVVVSGGGARNAHLLGSLAMRLGPAFEVVRSDALGVDPDAKEALAFAILGYELLRGRSAGLPGVSGASSPALLGALAPHRLRALLAKMDAELTENAAE